MAYESSIRMTFFEAETIHLECFHKFVHRLQTGAEMLTRPQYYEAMTHETEVEARTHEADQRGRGQDPRGRGQDPARGRGRGQVHEAAEV